MRSRSRAREIALQYLYQVDLTSAHSPQVFREFVAHFVDDDEIVPYAETLVEGVYDHLARIDELIERSAKNWTVSRMSSTDRNILRIATFELIYRGDVPYKVAITEGIELAKRYGSPKFPAFVNGVLDHVRTEGLNDGGAGRQP